MEYPIKDRTFNYTFPVAARELAAGIPVNNAVDLIS